MISIPFFTKDTYMPDPTSFEAGINFIYRESKYYKNAGYEKGKADSEYTNYKLLELYSDFIIKYHENEDNDAVDRYPVFFFILNI